MQSGNWVKLHVVDFWWLAGRPLTQKLEQAVFKALEGRCGRLCGEWFDIESSTAAKVCEGAIREAGLPFVKEWDLLRAEKAIDEIAWASVLSADFDFQTKSFVVRSSMTMADLERRRS